MTHFFGGNLQDTAVIGDKSVCFVLDIAYLRVNRSTESVLYKRNYLVFVQGNERIFKFARIVEFFVAVGSVKVEECSATSYQYRLNSGSAVAIKENAFLVNVGDAFYLQALGDGATYDHSEWALIIAK